MFFVLHDNLLAQCQMVLRAGRVGIVENNGQPMTGALREFHITLNHGFEHQLLEMTLHFVVNLVGQT